MDYGFSFHDVTVKGSKDKELFGVGLTGLLVVTLVPERTKPRAHIPWADISKLSHRGKTIAITTSLGKIKLTAPSEVRATYLYSRAGSYHKFSDLLSKRMRQASLRYKATIRNATGQSQAAHEPHTGPVPNSATAPGSNRLRFGAPRTIKLLRDDPGASLGFGISSIFQDGEQIVAIKSIAPNGIAAKDGRLQIGDRIVSYNGTAFADKGVDKIVQVLKQPSVEVEIVAAPASTEMNASTIDKSTRTVLLVVPPGQAPGFSIVGGSDTALEDVYLNRVFDASPAAEAGLRSGDEILSVNDVQFSGLTHAQAIDALESAGATLRITVHEVPTEEYHNRFVRAATQKAPKASVREPKLVGSASDQVTSLQTQPSLSRADQLSSPQSGNVQRILLAPGSDDFTEGPVEDVRVKRGPSGFGLSLIGGSDTNLGGLFVSNVVPDGANSGVLRVGDRILAVNGTSLNNLTRREILPLAGNKDSMIMTIMRVDPEVYRKLFEKAEGIEQQRGDNTLQVQQTSIKLTPQESPFQTFQPPKQPDTLAQNSIKTNILRVPLLPESKEFTEGPVVDIELERGADGFGCFLLGGNDTGIGAVFVKSIVPGGVAERSGHIRAGDRILDVNGRSFVDISHGEMKEVFRTTQHMKIKIMHVAPEQYAELLQRADKIEAALREQKSLKSAPTSPSVPSRIPLLSGSNDFTEGLVEKITVKRGRDGYGFILAGGSDTEFKAFFVRGVDPNGPAAQTTLHANDRILSVNGHALMDRKYPEAENALLATMQAELLVMHVDQKQFEALFTHELALQAQSRNASQKSRDKPIADVALEQARPRNPSVNSIAQHLLERSSTGSFSSVQVPLLPQSEEFTQGPMEEVKIVRGSHGYGIVLVGGSDTGIGGVFIKGLTPGGLAEKSGKLRVGDRILKVNEQSFMDIRYHAAIEFFKASKELNMLVMHVSTERYNELLLRGEAIEKELRENASVQSTATSAEDKGIPSRIPLVQGSDEYTEGIVERASVTRDDNGFGLLLVGGSDTGFRAVFIEGIEENSAAYKVPALRPYDRILSVNGVSFMNAKNDEVFDAFKGAQVANLVIMHVSRDQFEKLAARDDAMQAQREEAEQAEIKLLQHQLEQQKRVAEEKLHEQETQQHANADPVAQPNGHTFNGDGSARQNGKVADSGLQNRNASVKSTSSYSAGEYKVPLTPQSQEFTIGHIEKVTVARGPNGFGLSLMGGSESPIGAIFVKTIVPGGAADEATVCSGDRILAVNGKDLMGCPLTDIITIVKAAKDALSMTIMRTDPEQVAQLVKRAGGDASALEKAASIKRAQNSIRMNEVNPAQVYSTSQSALQTVSQFQFARLPLSTNSAIETEGEVEEILLNKGERGFGFSIIGGIDTPVKAVFVKTILPDGPADKDGRLRITDRILAVNGRDFMDISNADTVKNMQGVDEVHLRIMHLHADAYRQIDALDTLKQRPLSFRDHAAQGGVTSRAPLVSTSHHFTEGHVATIELQRGKEGFGFVLQGGRDTQQRGIFIKKILPNSPLSTFASVKVGDRVLAVNEHNLLDTTLVEATDLVKASSSSLKLTIMHLTEEQLNVLMQQRLTDFNNASAPNDSGQAQPSTISIPPAPVRNSSLRSSKSMLTTVHEEPLAEVVAKKMLPPNETLSVSQDSESGDLVTVRLVRGSKGFGLGVHGGSDTPLKKITVKIVYDDTPASRDGRISVNDQIISVNQFSLLNATHSEAIRILKEAPDQTDIVIRKVVRGDKKKRARKTLEPDSDKSTNSAVPPSIPPAAAIVASEPHRSDSVASNRSQSPSTNMSIEIKAGPNGFGFAISGGDEQIPVHFIKKVSEGSPAEAAGLRRYDTVLEINGHLLPGRTNAEAVSYVRESNVCVMKIRRSSDHPQNLMPYSPSTECTQSTIQTSALSDGPIPSELSLAKDSSVVLRSEVPKQKRYEVELTKGSDGLGLIFNSDDTDNIIVKGVKAGSAAALVGGILPGDLLQGVNGVSIVGMSRNDAMQLLKQLSGQIKFQFVRTNEAGLGVAPTTNGANRDSIASFELSRNSSPAVASFGAASTIANAPPATAVPPPTISDVPASPAQPTSPQAPVSPASHSQASVDSPDAMLRIPSPPSDSTRASPQKMHMKQTLPPIPPTPPRPIIEDSDEDDEGASDSPPPPPPPSTLPPSGRLLENGGSLRLPARIPSPNQSGINEVCDHS